MKYLKKGCLVIFKNQVAVVVGNYGNTVSISIKGCQSMHYAAVDSLLVISTKHANSNTSEKTALNALCSL